MHDAMSSRHKDRYSRQVLFTGIGPKGQAKLEASRITIVGCGATGSVLASLLGRAGVGTIRIIDRDFVESSNLQRQSLFDENDVEQSMPKSVGAARKIAAFNSEVVVDPRIADLTPTNVEELLDNNQLILDGTDNFETRYLINDFAIENSVPWIYTAAVGSYGATMNVVPGKTACLACVFTEPPKGAIETCETAGVLNSAVNLISSIAATEAIKILVGAEDRIRQTLLSFDVWENEQAEVPAQRPRSQCRTCGDRDFVHRRGDDRPHITLCGRNSVQIHERHRPVDLAEMCETLTPHGAVRHNEFVLKFWRDPYEMTLFPDGRAIIKGTVDPAVARSLYARYVGN